VTPSYKTTPPASTQNNGQSGKVNPEQRFTHGRTCPICHGSDDERRGTGERCYGFLSTDGEWAHCTRPEYAGLSPLHAFTNAYPHRLKGKCPCGTEHAPADPKPRRTRAKLGRQVAVYEYTDADGLILFEVVRYADPKTFRQRRPTPSGKWEWNLDGVALVPYRLRELAASDPAYQAVFISEGEKDVDALGAVGLIATCNPMGAKKWRPEFSDHLSGRYVAILPDNDEDGRIHGQQVARSLYGKAASVKVVELPGLPVKGDVSDWLAAGGTVEALKALVKAAPVWKPTAPATVATQPARPVIEVNHELHRMLAETLAVLPLDPDLYCRGNVLVRVVREREDTAKLAGGVTLHNAAGMARVVPLDEAGLGCQLPALADFVTWHKDRNGEDFSTPTTSPSIIVRAILSHAEYPGVRPLRAIASAPFPRPDGSLVTTPGYDAATGVYLAPGVALAPIPDGSTREDAQAAARRILAPFAQFPFASDDDRAVFLAGVMGAIARPGIEGSAPGTAVVSNLRGTGKGKLIDATGIIVTGCAVPTTSYPYDDAEAKKVKASLAIACTEIVHLDNIDAGHEYGNGGLDSALTSLTVNERILGQSKQTGPIELRPSWFLSGNNITPGKDADRRWLVCNLVTDLERPEERADLKIADLLGYVAEHRAQLLHDALVIFKAHAMAGRPTNGWAPLGSFEQWDPVVRGAVWFAYGHDCNTTRRKAAEETPDRLARLALMKAWEEAPNGGPKGSGITTPEAIRLASPIDKIPAQCPDLTDALMQFSRDGKLPPSRVIGNTIRRIQGSNIGDKIFRKASSKDNYVRWRVENATPSGTESTESKESTPQSPRIENQTDQDVMALSRDGQQSGAEWQTDSVDSVDSSPPSCGGCLRLNCLECQR
jgi:putative DNA primase/helicase